MLFALLAQIALGAFLVKAVPWGAHGFLVSMVGADVIAGADGQRLTFPLRIRCLVPLVQVSTLAFDCNTSSSAGRLSGVGELRRQL